MHGGRLGRTGTAAHRDPSAVIWYQQDLMTSLAGKVVAVTGASGIAASAALRFADEGARVLVFSIEEGECVALGSKISAKGAENHWVAVDLRDGDATEGAFAAGHARFGRLDGLFAVAGGSGRRFGDGPLHELSTEAWRSTLELNDLPAFHAVRAALRIMLGEQSSGSIVVISSVLALAPSPRLFATHAYAVAKSETLSMVRTAASYYTPHRIRINGIAPGLVDTPMAARAAADPETLVYARRKQPLAGGLLDPAEIAAAAVFLLSDQSRMFTGQILAVDGGWSVTEVS